ncbi:MAG: cytochrome c biogenesis protein CcdA, partial [Polyangiales bacterium]
MKPTSPRASNRLPLLAALASAVLVLITASTALAATAATGAEPPQGDLFSRALESGGALVAFGAAFLAGLAACATPCVYPMIGITVSVFGAKQAKSRKESAVLSGLFVLGIAALYTPLGLIVALSNSVWGRALSNPYVTLGLAGLFVVMAASMFGAFELNLPASIQNKLANVGGVGPKGAFLMGMVSGLIASPCTTAPFASILGSFTHSGVAVGTTSVFLFSVGLGTPFFIVGTFAARLPKPGGWMQHVKSFFGIVLLVLAFFYAKNAIPALRTVAHRGTTFLALALAAIFVGFAIGAVHLSFGGTSTIERLRKGAGIVLGTWGGFALVSWLQLEPSTHVRALAADIQEQFADATGKGSNEPRPVIWSKSDQEAR